MQTIFLKQSLFVTAFATLLLIACGRSKSATVAEKEVGGQAHHTDSSKGLRESCYNIPVQQAGDHTCFAGSMYKRTNATNQPEAAYDETIIIFELK